jgi:hypothetical protein
MNTLVNTNEHLLQLNNINLKIINTIDLTLVLELYILELVI